MSWMTSEVISFSDFGPVQKLYKLIQFVYSLAQTGHKLYSTVCVQFLGGTKQGLLGCGSATRVGNSAESNTGTPL